jgi:hypothetical protein
MLSFDETLSFDLASSADEGSPPTLSLVSALGLSAQASTFVTTGQASWRAQADDTVLVGADLGFDPNGLLLGVALEPALREFSDATDVRTALGLAWCPLVAQTLIAHGEASKQSLAGCNEKCTNALCKTGVTALFARASAPAPEPATLALALTGPGGVDDNANLVSLGGTWLGKLTMPAPSTSSSSEPPPPIGLKGEAKAELIPASD